MKRFPVLVLALSLSVALLGVGCGDDDVVETECMNDGQCAELGANWRCDLTTNTCRCVPACAGLCCGDDGCGGSCVDNCAASGETCNTETCLCEGGVTCIDGETRCAGNVVETCNDNAWTATTNCATDGQVCVDGACQAQTVCSDGETRCDGDLVETCNDNVWSVTSNCANFNQICVDGACQAQTVCTDGQTRCSGDVVETCSDNAWGMTTNCALSDETCEVIAGTAQCVACTPDCTGRECGDDGCGGSCGTCAAGESCNASGICESSGCIELTFADGALIPDPSYPSMYYNEGFTPALGTVLPDWSQLEFYTGATGSVNLGDATNGNYASCDQCVRFFEDYDETDGSIARQYFQQTGSMVITAGSDPLNGSIELSLSDVTLVEVTIASDGSYTSTPVEGGACLHITSATLSTDIACTPDCTGRECGDDGCGGSCGTCAVGESCNASGICEGCTPDCTGRECGDDGCGGSCGTCAAGESCNASGICEGGVSCTELTYAGTLTADGTYVGYFYTSDFTPTLGDAATTDWTDLEFYTNATGSIDLASVGVNDNYGTCEQCVMIYEDDTKRYYVTSGSMTVDPSTPPQDGSLNVTLSDVTLVEVTIASDGSYTSTPVEGGACLHITSATLSTDIACTPDCTGRECGDDGCGGSCGTCAAGETCNASGICEADTGCTEIVYAGNLVDLGSDGTVGAYYGDLNTALGEAGLVDYGQFEFYDGTTGTVDLGDATNGNYATCMQCVRVFEDYDETAGTIARQYFQQMGTMVIDGSSDPRSGTAAFDLADVTLVEVTIASDGSYTSTPVEGGACLHITAVSLDTSGACVPDCTGRECGDDGCGGSCGTCAAGETCNATGQCVSSSGGHGELCSGDGDCDASLRCIIIWGSVGYCAGACDCNDGSGCPGGLSPQPECVWDVGDGTCACGYLCPTGTNAQCPNQSDWECYDISGSGDYICVNDCVPDCTGRECGDDGCGGSCGTCPAGEICNASGICEVGGGGVVGDLCEDNTECNSGICLFFDTAGFCSEECDCDTGETCIDSICLWSDGTGACWCGFMCESGDVSECPNGGVGWDCNQDYGAWACVPTGGGSTCGATPIGLGTINGDTCGGSSMYNPGVGNDCTGYSASANELLYELTVPAGATYQLDLAYSTGDVDASLYALTDCLDTAAVTCAFGADNLTDGAETLLIDAAGTYYIVVDGFTSGDCGAFSLSVTAL